MIRRKERIQGREDGGKGYRGENTEGEDTGERRRRERIQGRKDGGRRYKGMIRRRERIQGDDKKG